MVAIDKRSVGPGKQIRHPMIDDCVASFVPRSLACREKSIYSTEAPATIATKAHKSVVETTNAVEPLADWSMELPVERVGCKVAREVEVDREPSVGFVEVTVAEETTEDEAEEAGTSSEVGAVVETEAIGLVTEAGTGDEVPVTAVTAEAATGTEEEEVATGAAGEAELVRGCWKKSRGEMERTEREREGGGEEKKSQRQ